MIVLAGPGSGKTTVILERISRLIASGVRPSGIAAVTFTKSAAEDMKKSFLASQISAPSSGAGISISTFHALFFGMLKTSTGLKSENLLDETKRKDLIQHILKSLRLCRPDDSEYLNGMLAELSFVRNEMIDPSGHYPLNFPRESFLRVFHAYENWKEDNGRFDFDDMSYKCHGILADEKTLEFWQRRYEYLLIDEFQDINSIQYECVKLLAGTRGNLFAVGDDDQSIYRFRGSRPEFMLNFQNDFPGAKKVTLETNYRSTERIISFCGSIIKGNEKRFDKLICGVKTEGDGPVFLYPNNINGEAKLVAEIIGKKVRQGVCGYDTIAVLYRTNIQSRAIADELLAAGIPFIARDTTPGVYEHFTSADILSYLQAADKDSEAAARIINKPTRYIKTAWVEKAAARQGFIVDNLIGSGVFEPYLMKNLYDFKNQLAQIKKLSSKNLGYAVKYIRKNAGYDDYVVKLAQKLGSPHTGMFEIMDEFTEAASDFESTDSFLSHIRAATAENRLSRKKQPGQGVTLSTIHSAKGLEFDTVIILSAVDGLIPYERSRSAAEIEEERRLLYVAASRAQNSLYISFVKSRYDRETRPTRFIPERYYKELK